MRPAAYAAASLVVLVAAPCSGAATARVADGTTVVYRAATGERNDVTFTYVVTAKDEEDQPVEARVTLADAGATITAGRGCTSQAPNVALCDVEPFLFSDAAILRLGDGADAFRGSDQCARDECPVRVFGGPGHDHLVGTEGWDELHGDGGDDVLEGGAGVSCCFGDTVGDFLLGGAGDDVLRGGRHLDYLHGGAGSDVLRGGPGPDMVSYQGYAQPVRVDLRRISGQGAYGERDTIGGDVEDAHGGMGADVLIGDRRPNHIVGGLGDDVIHGQPGRDLLFGSNGDDVVRGGDGSDIVVGSELHPRFGLATRDAGSGRDGLFGGDGVDALLSLDGRRDCVRGGPGVDRATVDAALDDVRGVERVTRETMTR